MNNAHLIIWAATLLIMLLASLAGCIASIPEQEGSCLIYGIDFNQRNERFGLFCD